MSTDRNHLTPKQITDKNGKRTTVRVNDRKSDGAANADKLGSLSAPSSFGKQNNTLTMDELDSDERDTVRSRVVDGALDMTWNDIDGEVNSKLHSSDDLSSDTIDSILGDPTRRGLSGHYEDDEDGYELKLAQRNTAEGLLRKNIESKSNELKNLDSDDEDRIPGDFDFDEEFDDDYMEDLVDNALRDYDQNPFLQREIDNAKPRGFEYTAGRVSKDQVEIGDDREIAKEVLPDDATEEEVEKVSKSVRDLVNSELTGNDSMKIDLLWNGKPSDVVNPDGIPDTASPSNENKRAMWRVQANGMSHYAPYPADRMEMTTFLGSTPQMSVSDDLMAMTVEDDE